MLYQTSWGRYVSGRAVWLLVASQLIVKLILKGVQVERLYSVALKMPSQSSFSIYILLVFAPFTLFFS